MAAMELDNAFDRVLNLDGTNPNDSMRVHKNKRHGTNHQIRHQTRDLTPEILNKVVERNHWNEPETKTRQQRAAWAMVQEREATVQRDRF